jgi:hypothetical protein
VNWKNLSKHDKAEIASGISYLGFYAGAMIHILTGDIWISASVTTIATVAAMYYGVMHLKAKREEKRS